MVGDEKTTPASPEEQSGYQGGIVGRYGGIIGTPTGMLVAIASAFGILLAMRYAQGVLNPILLSMFIVMGVSPILHFLRRKGVPPWLTLVIMITLMLCVLILFIAVFAGSLGQLDEKLPAYQENVQDLTDDMTAWFADRDIDISGVTDDVLSPPKLFDFLTGLVGSLINAMSSLLLMIMIVAFMIAEVYSFPKKLFGITPGKNNLSKALEQFSEVTRAFLFTKAWLSAIAAVIVTAIYFAMGVDFALLWGLLFFVLSFIPNIGFVLSVIPPFFITMLEFGFARAILVVVIVVVFNFIIDNLFAPRVMAKSVGLSTLAVFLSLVVWAWVLGGIGALISIPMTLMVKHLFLNAYPTTLPVSAAIGPPEVVPKEKKTRRLKRRKPKADSDS